MVIKEYSSENSVVWTPTEAGTYSVRVEVRDSAGNVRMSGKNFVVESKLKKIKKPNNASLLVIESGCELCEGGEFPPDEDVVLPPFHPYCNCTYYYEITDSEDDINDLDLEIEE